GERRRERAQVVDVEPVALRRFVGIRMPLHVGGPERSVLTHRVLVIHARELAVGPGLRQLILLEIERLEGVWTGFEAADRRELERLAYAAPVTAARAALRGAIPQQHAVSELVASAADREVEHVLAVADALSRAPPDVSIFD